MDYLEIIRYSYNRLILIGQNNMYTPVYVDAFSYPKLHSK